MTFLLLPIYFIISGLVGVYVWNGLLVEMVEIREIVFWEALAISIVCDWFFGKYENVNFKNNEEKIKYYVGVLFIRPVTVVFLVWLVSNFI